MGVMMNETIALGEIAHSRSGDKGNHANVAVLAYTPEGYLWIKRHLTTEAIAQHFAALGATRIGRYEAANVLGLNFMLYDALGGGASRSLRIDTQGKALGQAVLAMRLPRPENLAKMK
jgi:hypothetical protein